LNPPDVHGYAHVHIEGPVPGSGTLPLAKSVLSRKGREPCLRHDKSTKRLSPCGLQVLENFSQYTDFGKWKVRWNCTFVFYKTGV